MPTLFEEMNRQGESTVVSPSDVQNERHKYELPQVRVGMTVLWYRHNFPDQRGMLGTVMRVNKLHKHVNLLVPYDAQGDMKEGAYYIQDPILKLGRDAAEGGCWEFTEESMYWIKLLANLERRISDVEKGVLARGAPEKMQAQIDELKRDLKKYVPSK